MALTVDQYKDWLGGENPRVTLVTAAVTVSGIATTRYLSDGAYRTGPSESPANTIFESRLMAETEIERTMGSVFGGRGGEANGGEIVIANPDGQLDAWKDDKWVGGAVNMYFGDPSWPYSDITARGKIFEGIVQSVQGDDQVLRVVVQGVHFKLNEPAQGVIETHGPNRGGRRMLCYGYPKNVEPQLMGTDPDDYYYRIHEIGELEDVAVNRYVNQAVSTSPSINKHPTRDNRHIVFSADPGGAVTVDAKGIKDSGGTWIQTAGASLKHMLTRTHPNTVGIVRGGSATSIQLELKEPSEDDALNTEDVRKSDANIDGGEERTINDYTGSTRNAEVSDWTSGGGVAAQEGDGYEILGRSMQVGPFAGAIDTAAFDDYDTGQGSPQIGLVVDRGQSYREVLEMVLGPGSGYWISRSGQISIGLLVDPSGQSADLELGANDTWGVIEWEKRPPPVERLRVGHDKNWTVNRGASTGDATAQRQEYARREFLWSVKQADEAQDEYHERDVETMLTTASDADDERDRLWTLFSVQRFLYTIHCLTKPMQVDINSIVSLTDSRYGLNDTNGVVVGIKERPMSGETELELWV